MCGTCVHVLRRRGGESHMFCPLCSNPVQLIGGPKPKKKSFMERLKQTVKVPFTRAQPPAE